MKDGRAGVAGETIARAVRESRARQGLPPKIEDPATLARAAAIFRLVETVVELPEAA